MKKVLFALLSSVSLWALIAATPDVIVDHSIVIGPPMKMVVLGGAYVDAINVAYGAWLGLKTRPLIASQKVTVSPEPGRHILYVRFMSIHFKPGYGGDVLYVIDTQKRRIIRRIFGT